MRRALCTLLLGAFAALMTVPAQARDFRVADNTASDYPTVEALRHMSKLVSERSNGRLGVKVFPNAALGNERDTIEQVKIGGLDMFRLSAAALNNIVPETIVTSLPYIFRSEEHMRKVLDGPIGDAILAAMEKQGMVGLAFYEDGPRSIYTKKPIKTLADLKGMKIRVQPSDMFVAMVHALGASPTPLPYGEVYTAITTGIIDGAENSVQSYESSRHFEAAKYYTLTEHTLVPSVVVFSKKIWDGLTSEDQKLIRQAAKDSVPYLREVLAKRAEASRKTVEAAGSQIVPVDNKQDFANAVTPIYSKFATTPELKSLIERVQAVN
ncbi:C4-dicarboxylate ABC transporter (plasmid) [Microvirga ossetica]|uniref:C4-dicarboxylate ABC transporter n=1 Tax=Microvirga ossetica TaxID=1882682 RepID=A0A1B2EVR7_9HYPH|nr:TRAP transporter substrate-binding protein [Microvirga ossetica]ANY84060.1 C4-dicarboxylate ABC transporter [Microvirga ossetica]